MAADRTMNNTSKNSRGQRPVWTNEVRYISLVGLIILIVYIAYLIRGSLTLVVIAALVAYLLSPIVRFFNRKLRIKRNLAIILAYILLLIVIIIGIESGRMIVKKVRKVPDPST